MHNCTDGRWAYNGTEINTEVFLPNGMLGIKYVTVQMLSKEN
jgi:hypothetical protein